MNGSYFVLAVTFSEFLSFVNCASRLLNKKISKIIGVLTLIDLTNLSCSFSRGRKISCDFRKYSHFTDTRGLLIVLISKQA